MRIAIGLTLVAMAATTAAAQPAGSQPAPPAKPTSPADQAALDGEALAANGDFLGAAAKFREAYGLDPRPELLCNVGVAFHKAKDLPRAQLYLGQCLGRVGSLDPSFATAIRAVYGSIEDKLRGGDFAPVDIVVAPSSATITLSAFEPDDKIIGSRLVWLPFGAHTVTVRAEGHVDDTRVIQVKSRDKVSERFALTRVMIEDPSGEILVEQRSWRPALYATIATGVVGLGAGGAYLFARSRATDAGELDISDAEYESRVDSARTWQKVSWVLAGAALAGAAISGYLWYQGTRPATRVEVQPTAGAGAALSLTHEF